MLVCPECGFHNPDRHRFCQQCGTSLAHKSCDACGAKVDFHLLNCPSCGAQTGTTWLAIASLTALSGTALPDTALPDTASSGTADEETTNLLIGSAIPATAPHLPAKAGDALEEPAIAISEEDTFTEPFLNREFLDPDTKRYQVLNIFPITRTSEICLRVLDCRPLQGTPLKSGEGQNGDVIIPPSAEPYLALSQKMYPALPELHNVWIDDRRTVLLLEERSHLAMLSGILGKEEVTLEQLLHWLRNMLELWMALQVWQCSQSLLVPENLRLDEDRVLCLQRLYADPAGDAPPLSDLGKLWRGWFQQSDVTLVDSIAVLISDVATGELTDVDMVRSRLEEVSEELQPYTPLPEEFSTAEVDDEDMPTIGLSVQLASLEDVGRTDTGRKRDRNEDTFAVWTEFQRSVTPLMRQVSGRGIYVLCDGMGGHEGGEIASALAANTLVEFFKTNWRATEGLPSADTIREGVRQANQAIYEENVKEMRSGRERMGTTLVMLLIRDNQAAVVHVGDSRLYTLTLEGELTQITADHEVGQRDINRGIAPEVAYSRPDAYQLTQALGPRPEEFVEPDIQFVEFYENTLVVLGSDGLTDNDFLETHTYELENLFDPSENLEEGADRLVELANAHNGHDNITAILIRIGVRPF